MEKQGRPKPLMEVRFLLGTPKYVSRETFYHLMGR